MTDNVYHYVVPLPEGIDESIAPCSDGYTIWTADRLTYEKRKEVFNHALEHIYRDDWSKDDVQIIESQ